MAAKLHELLAVEVDLEGAYQKIIKETIQTLTKRTDHFNGFTRTLEIFQPEDGEPEPPTEHKAIDTTVTAKLDYQKDHIIRYMDAVLQKEATNQTAKANIEIDGKVIAKDVPVTFLLALERFLARLRDVYSAIPTLPPGIDYDPAPDEGPNIYKRRYPKKEYKTEKRIVPQILTKATKEHPAQVDKISQTFNVGMYTRQELCSMITPAEKSVLLARIDEMSRGIKMARQRANRAEVVIREMGKSIFDYIHNNKSTGNV
jgi:hypothetical protein